MENMHTFLLMWLKKIDFSLILQKSEAFRQGINGEAE
jgi:hypothetical protein